MTFLDTMKPGDKIDIRLILQENRKEDGKEEEKIYCSSVFDCLSETELEIGMPTEGGKMILFQVGMQMDMIFYSSRGMYRCYAVVRDRYKKDNLYMLHVEAVTGLSKYQRRQFFRIDCYIDVKIFHMTDEVAGYSTTRQIYLASLEPDMSLNFSLGTILDISGGGIRFISGEQYEKGRLLLYSFQLTNARVDQNFYIIGQIISSEAVPNNDGKFMNRCKFIFKELKDRETIVRYVFEEERILRQREMGAL